MKLLTNLIILLNPLPSLKANRLPLNRAKEGARSPTTDNFLRLMAIIRETKINPTEKEGLEKRSKSSGPDADGITLEVPKVTSLKFQTNLPPQVP